jgi:phosphoribosylformimino-5-aminoimidazole carboxamide ribotide isomerase
MELIPAIDLLGGSAVRLLRGSYDAATIYSDDPAGLAASWRGQVPRIHVVDLEAARAGKPEQLALVRRMARAFGPGLQVGGGARSLETVAAYFSLGVERVVLGSAAVDDPSLVRRAALGHPGRIIVAVDAREGKVATDGWERQSSVSAVDLVRELDALPLAAILYTDILRDGTEAGPNVEATAALCAVTKLPVIASGGVGTLDHIAALAREKVAGVIVGRALHEGRFTLAEAVARAAG